MCNNNNNMHCKHASPACSMATADASWIRSAHPTSGCLSLIGCSSWSAFTRPALAPWLISGSKRMEPFAPPHLEFKNKTAREIQHSRVKKSGALVGIELGEEGRAVCVSRVCAFSWAPYGVRRQTSARSFDAREGERCYLNNVFAIKNNNNIHEMVYQATVAQFVYVCVYVLS